MKLALITCSEQPVDFFDELGTFLAEESLDIATEAFYAPSFLDMPLLAKQVSETKEFDMVFIIYLFEEKNPLNEAVLSKLIDVELQTGIKSIKVIEESDLPAILTEESLEDEKANLVEKWGKYIIDVINYPEKFKPEFESEEEEL